MPAVWIEHGQQHDPINSFYVEETPYWSEARPPIIADSDGVPRLHECIGTRFLIRFLNRLDKTYPFVDNVKPFSRFFKLFLKSSVVPGFGPLRAAVAAWGMLRFIGQSVGTAPGDLLEAHNEPALPPPETWLKAHINAMSTRTRNAFSDRLSEHGFQAEVSLDLQVGDRARAQKLLGFLSDNPAALDAVPDAAPSNLGVGSERGMLSLSRGLLSDETALLRSAAARIRKECNDVCTVLMGHTHESIDALPGYVNMGCWIRCFHDGAHERLRSWETLRMRSFEQFPFRLSSVHINPKDDLPVRVMVFPSGGKV